MPKHFDIDIDTPRSFDPLKVFPMAVRASVVRDGELAPHPCGVYVQTVPKDPLTGLAAAPYKLADELGCFKIDFLHLGVYDTFSDRALMLELLEIEPDWNLLLIPSIVRELFQLKNYGAMLRQLRPTSLLELADALALIRPKKQYLLEYYMKDPKKCRLLLYQREEGDGQSFKKAHAVAYAQVVWLQLHILKHT